MQYSNLLFYVYAGVLISRNSSFARPTTSDNDLSDVAPIICKVAGTVYEAREALEGIRQATISPPAGMDLTAFRSILESCIAQQTLNTAGSVLSAVPGIPADATLTVSLALPSALSPTIQKLADLPYSQPLVHTPLVSLPAVTTPTISSGTLDPSAVAHKAHLDGAFHKIGDVASPASLFAIPTAVKLAPVISPALPSESDHRVSVSAELHVSPTLQASVSAPAFPSSLLRPSLNRENALPHVSLLTTAPSLLPVPTKSRMIKLFAQSSQSSVLEPVSTALPAHPGKVVKLHAISSSPDDQPIDHPPSGLGIDESIQGLSVSVGATVMPPASSTPTSSPTTVSSDSASQGQTSSVDESSTTVTGPSSADTQQPSASSSSDPSPTPTSFSEGQTSSLQGSSTAASDASSSSDSSPTSTSSSEGQTSTLQESSTAASDASSTPTSQPSDSSSSDAGTTSTSLPSSDASSTSTATGKPNKHHAQHGNTASSQDSATAPSEASSTATSQPSVSSPSDADTTSIPSPSSGASSTSPAADLPSILRKPNKHHAQHGNEAAPSGSAVPADDAGQASQSPETPAEPAASDPGSPEVVPSPLASDSNGSTHRKLPKLLVPLRKPFRGGAASVTPTDQAPGSAETSAEPPLIAGSVSASYSLSATGLEATLPPSGVPSTLAGPSLSTGPLNSAPTAVTTPYVLSTTPTPSVIAGQGSQSMQSTDGGLTVVAIASASTSTVLKPRSDSPSDSIETSASVADTAVPTSTSVDDTTVPTSTSLEDTAVPTSTSVEDMTVPTSTPEEDTAVPTSTPVEDTAVPTSTSVEDTTVPTSTSMEDTAVPTSTSLDNTAVPTSTPVEDTTVPTLVASESSIAEAETRTLAASSTSVVSSEAIEPSSTPASLKREATTPPSACGLASVNNLGDGVCVSGI